MGTEPRTPNKVIFIVYLFDSFILDSLVSTLLEKTAIQEKLWAFLLKQPCPFPEIVRPSTRGKKLIARECFSEPKETYFLELGSGWGEVALELAEKNPQTGFLLWEKKLDRIRTTEKFRKKLQLSNIRYLSVNFLWFFEEIWEKEQFQTILINFPDPWPKKKHWKNRIMQPQFLDVILNWLRPGGRLLFATDHAPYARKTIKLFRNYPSLRYSDSEFSFSRPGFPPSRFETEKKEEGKRIYYLERIKS